MYFMGTAKSPAAIARTFCLILVPFASQYSLFLAWLEFFFHGPLATFDHGFATLCQNRAHGENKPNWNTDLKIREMQRFDQQTPNPLSNPFSTI